METFQKYETILHEEMLTVLGCTEPVAIAFLQGADTDMLGMIITNTQANVGGIVCDGAQSSARPKLPARWKRACWVTRWPSGAMCSARARAL